MRTWTCKRCGLDTSADHQPGDCIAALRKYTNRLADQVAKMVGERITLWKTIDDLKAAAKKSTPQASDPGWRSYAEGAHIRENFIKSHHLHADKRFSWAAQVLAPDGSAPAPQEFRVYKSPPVGWRRRKDTHELVKVVPATQRAERLVVRHQNEQAFVRSPAEVEVLTEPAIPRNGEIWCNRRCSKPFAQMAGIAHANFEVHGSSWDGDATSQALLAERVACGCLTPVNFGRG